MKQGQRLDLWEIAPSMHCSVIGTCLAPADIKTILRKCRLQSMPGAADYQVHGFLVAEAGKQGPVGRAIDALLDKKFAGPIRQVTRLSDESALRDYWAAARRKGTVAGAYWALLTHPDLPQPLAVEIFGDVHMLGHFMSGVNRDERAALWAAEQRSLALEERLQRVRRQAEERDLGRIARIQVLEAEVATLRAAACPTPAVEPPRSGRSGRPARLEKRLDKLAAMRARLDQLANDNAALEARLAAETRLQALPSLPAELTSAGRRGQPAACRVTVLRALLYVGGRPSALPHLRAGAARHRAEFLHHDGGIEESVSRLDELVPRADIVFCPVDCVSHNASLRARALCRRHAKPFVPLRSASASHFSRLVEAMAPLPADRANAEPDQPPTAPAIPQPDQPPS